LEVRYSTTGFFDRQNFYSRKHGYHSDQNLLELAGTEIVWKLFPRIRKKWWK
jgi:hypothetical protein